MEWSIIKEPSYLKSAGCLPDHAFSRSAPYTCGLHVVTTGVATFTSFHFPLQVPAGLSHTCRRHVAFILPTGCCDCLHTASDNRLPQALTDIMFRLRVAFDTTRLLSTFLHRRSNRIIATANSTPLTTKSRRIDSVFVVDTEAQLAIPLSDCPAIRDTEYYKDESDGGFCIFRVENTLFKVSSYCVVNI